MTTDFFFQRDFDAELEAEAREREAAATDESFSAEQLQEACENARIQARTEAHEEGRIAGLDEARAEIAAQHAMAAENLVREINLMISDRQAHRDRLEGDMTGFVRDVCDRVLPEVVKIYGERRVTEEVTRIVGRAIGSPYLRIGVAPGAIDVVRDALAGSVRGDPEACEIVEEPEYSPSEVSATWRDGRSRYAFDAICRNIISVLDGESENLGKDGDS